MHELYFIRNVKILPYTMALTPIELVEHTRYTDVESMQYLGMDIFVE